LKDEGERIIHERYVPTVNESAKRRPDEKGNALKKCLHKEPRKRRRDKTVKKGEGTDLRQFL